MLLLRKGREHSTSILAEKELKMTSSNQLQMMPRTMQKVVPPSTPLVPYSQGRHELTLARDTVTILTHHGIPAKPFTIFNDAQPGLSFLVVSRNWIGWRCEDYEQNSDQVPAMAKMSLVAAQQLSVPIGCSRGKGCQDFSTPNQVPR